MRKLLCQISISVLHVTLCFSSLLDDEPSRSLNYLVMPKKVENYYVLSSQEIEEQLQQWVEQYPNLTRVTTAQERYNLPRAGGTRDDCPFVDGDGCPNSILTIQDFVAHPEGSDSSKRLPEVFWSGALHGNEEVGPTAVMKAADLLLRATACLAFPRMSVQSETPSKWNEEIQNAKKCRQEFDDFGIHEYPLRWLGLLLTTRRIVIVPTANALGYFRSEREENGIDPNRDFPFDLAPTGKNAQHSTECMQTIAARMLNEIFREHMFQLSLSFHAGMEAIGYEWGAISYKGRKSVSPDDSVQNQVAAAYSRFGGTWPGTLPYPYGPMNTKVYPVHGGMEDWSYAGSWDIDHVIPCKPTTYSDYPIEKTVYNNATLRVLNMLVETNDNKKPVGDLGSSAAILDEHSVLGNGHISRNIRLAILSAELVQPWLSIRRVNEIKMSDDIIPLMDRSGRTSCQTSRQVSLPRHSGRVVIEWVVGGSLRIEQTKLFYAKWSDLPELNCVDQPPQNIEQRMREGVPISGTSGRTKFSTMSKASMAHFAASMDVSGFEQGDKIVVMVAARVDQDWGMQEGSASPDGVPPQSHAANVRTNPDWYFESGDKIIEGRLNWFSGPLTIVLRDSNKLIETIEVSRRLPLPAEDGQNLIPPVPESSGKKNEKQDKEGSTLVQDRFQFYFYLVLFGGCVSFMIRWFRPRFSRRNQRSHMRHLAVDRADGFFTTFYVPVGIGGLIGGYKDLPNEDEGANGVEMESYI